MLIHESNLQSAGLWELTRALRLVGACLKAETSKVIGVQGHRSSAGGDERILEKDAHRGPVSARQFVIYNLRGGKVSDDFFVTSSTTTGEQRPSTSRVSRRRKGNPTRRASPRFSACGSNCYECGCAFLLPLFCSPSPAQTVYSDCRYLTSPSPRAGIHRRWTAALINEPPAQPSGATRLPNSRDHNRSTSSRRSTDSLVTNPELEGQPPLSCTTSNRSDVSTYSGYAPSVASVNSHGSTASTKRMIIPLYNLQAHNIMTNAVLERWARRARREIFEARSRGHRSHRSRFGGSL